MRFGFYGVPCKCHVQQTANEESIKNLGVSVLLVITLLPEDSMAFGYKPLPLKQRTSSLDQRRDYSTQTWTSVIGILKVREFFVTVDHFSIWRRHVAWATESGKDLRSYLTQRYASSMVFLSLLLSTELGVLFNSSGVTTEMRQALAKEEFNSTSFWCGILIIASAILTLLSLISTFTAWTMVSAVSAENAHCVFRSAIGMYAAELPGRFVVGAIYTFLAWICLFFFLLLPVGFWSTLLLCFALGLFVHTITTFSSFGRIIMHSGAMSSAPIFEKAYEKQLLPHSLHRMLLAKAKANLANKTSIRRQYMSQTRPLGRHFSEEELSCHLSSLSQRTQDTVPPPALRRRASSIVKFADGVDTNGDIVNDLPPISAHFSAALSPLTVDGSHGAPSQLQSPRTSLTQRTTPPSPRPPSPRPLSRPPRPNLSRKQSEERGGGDTMQSFEDISSIQDSMPHVKSEDSCTGRQNHNFVERWIQQQQQEQEDSWPEIVLEHNYPVQRPSLWSNSDLTTTSSLELSEEDANERFERNYGDLFDPEHQHLLGHIQSTDSADIHIYGATNEREGSANTIESMIFE